MKKNFRIAAIALTAVALMAACNNNKNAEEIADTLPAIDTTVVDSVVTDTVVVEEPVEATPAPAKKATPAKKKTKGEQVAEDIKTVRTASLEMKKDVKTVTDELKKAEDGANAQTKSLGGPKKPASEAFKKN